jgi:hypothetical protein
MVEWSQDILRCESPTRYVDSHHTKTRTHWGDTGSHMDVATLKMIPWGFPRLPIVLHVIACMSSFSLLLFHSIVQVCSRESLTPT